MVSEPESLSTQVTYLPVKSDGLIDMQQLKDAIRPETALVSIMMVNNEIGEHPAALVTPRWLASGLPQPQRLMSYLCH